MSRRVALTNVPVYVGEEEGDDSRAVGAPGEYEVTFILSAPGNEAFLTQMDVKEFLESGYSLLQLPPGTHAVVVNVPGQAPAPVLKLLPNASGLVGTAVVRFRFGVLARAVPTDNNRYVSKPELRYVLSAYREGMNAINAMYQACCFYRVIEGAHRLRARRPAAAGSAYREPTNEVMPSGEALAALNLHDRVALAPYAGRTFG
ncbi:MAG TPA: hypothetical protein VFC31_14100 [Candidatus Limnocylindria bacterium]|nr:hypothetical protein [Candidatus Limnocylindria bacterium]